MQLILLKKQITVADNKIVPNPGTKISYIKATNGYTMVRINGVYYALHKILIAFKENKWPEIVDHIDRNPANNSIENLRSCTRSDNNCNRGMRSDNTLGYKGLFTRKTKKGVVYGWMIKYAGRSISKSGFKTIEEAYKSRCENVLLAHGDFATNI